MEQTMTGERAAGRATLVSRGRKPGGLERATIVAKRAGTCVMALERTHYPGGIDGSPQGLPYARGKQVYQPAWGAFWHGLRDTLG